MAHFFDYSPETFKQIHQESVRIIWKILYYAYEVHKDAPPRATRLVGRGEEFARHVSKYTNNYCMRMYRHSQDPLTRHSQLADELASLMVNIATEGKIFAVPCHEIAAEIGECLMQSEGCEFKGNDSPKVRDKFFREIAVVDMGDESFPHRAHKKIKRSLKKHWKYTGKFQNEKFAEVDIWRDFDRGNNLNETLVELVPVSTN